MRHWPPSQRGMAGARWIVQLRLSGARMLFVRKTCWVVAESVAGVRWRGESIMVDDEVSKAVADVEVVMLSTKQRDGASQSWACGGHPFLRHQGRKSLNWTSRLHSFTCLQLHSNSMIDRSIL